MKKIKQFLLVLLITTTSIAAVTCSYVKDEDSTVKITAVLLSKNILSFLEGGSGTLTATVMPINVANKKVLWESNATAVATVDTNGEITAMKAGMAIITVTTEEDAKTVTYTVTTTTLPVNNEHDTPMKRKVF